MSLEYSVAQANLQKLIDEFSNMGNSINEAQTRFSFIDSFLQDCLDWPKSITEVEVFESEGRTDYELGKPRVFILEAKATRDAFKIPPKRNRNRLSIQSLIRYDPAVKEAITQAQKYGAQRGVRLVAVSNGPQLIAFMATRDDGISPLEGDAIVFDGYEDLLKHFNVAYDFLSKSGIDERRLASELTSSVKTSLPSKLSSACLNYLTINIAAYSRKIFVTQHHL